MNMWQRLLQQRGAARSAPYSGPAGVQPTANDACKVFVGGLAWTAKWQDLKDHMGQVGTVSFVKVNTQDGTEFGRSRGTGYVIYSSPEEAQLAIQTLNGTSLLGKDIQVDVWTGSTGQGLSAAKAKGAGKAGVAASSFSSRSDLDGFGPYGKGPLGAPGRAGWVWMDEFGNINMDGYVVTGGFETQGGGSNVMSMVAAMMSQGGSGKGQGKAGNGKQKNWGPTIVNDHDDPSKLIRVSNLAPGADWKALKDHMKTAGRVEFCDVVKPGCGKVRYFSPEEAMQAVVVLNGSMLRGEEILCEPWAASG